MPFAPFHDYFPQVAEQEKRMITVLDGSSAGVPPGDYSLLEMYCDEPGCDCRRVFLYILSSFRKDVEAVGDSIVVLDLIPAIHFLPQL